MRSRCGNESRRRLTQGCRQSHFGLRVRTKERGLGHLTPQGHPPPGPARDPPHLARDACRLLEESVDSLVDSLPGPHVVPVSGSLDSRLILGLLRQRLTGSEILACTFGTPGTWDFEIGRRVARSCSVPHHAIDLQRFPWSEEVLMQRVGGRPELAGDLFEAALFHEIYRFGSGTYWIGLLGDPSRAPTSGGEDVRRSQTPITAQRWPSIVPSVRQQRQAWWLTWKRRGIGEPVNIL